MTAQEQHELDFLRRLIKRHWNQVRRYCDGRMTSVAAEYNEKTRVLMEYGVEFQQPDQTPWARDGMGRGYDGLTDEEAALGDKPWTYEEPTPEKRQFARLAAAAQKLLSDPGGHCVPAPLWDELHDALLEIQDPKGYAELMRQIIR